MAIGLYFAVQSDVWRNVINWATSFNRASPAEVEPAGRSADNFENSLSRSTVQQLILEATQLVDDLELSPLDRLERQRRRIKVAEELSNRTDNSRAEKFGVATKLSALRTRELIHFDNGLTSPESLAELSQLASRYLSSFDEDTLRQASIGNMTAVLVEKLLRAEEDGFTIENEITRNFESVCKKYGNDIIVAEEFYELLKRVHIHASDQDRDKFLAVYQTEFSKSRVERIKLMATDASNKLIDTEFDLARIFDVIDSQRPSAIQKLRSQINSAFVRGYISQYGYKRIYEGILDVTRAADYAVALELSEALEDSIKGKSTLSRLAAQTLRLKKRVRMVGQKLNLEAVQTIEGELFVQRNTAAPVKAMLFMPDGSFDESDQILFTVMRAAGKDVPKQKFNLSAVYVDTGGLGKASQELEKLNRLVKSIDSGILKTDIASGSELAEKLELNGKPLLLLLDRDNIVIGVDVKKGDFEKTYKDLQNRY